MISLAADKTSQLPFLKWVANPVCATTLNEVVQVAGMGQLLCLGFAVLSIVLAYRHLPIQKMRLSRAEVTLWTLWKSYSTEGTAEGACHHRERQKLRRS